MITLKNLEIEKVFNTLLRVDRTSTNLDFAVRFKNKNNFKILKEAYVNLTETFNDFFKENWTKVSKNGKELWDFWDKKDMVADKIKEIYDIEVELDLKVIKISVVKDPATWLTDPQGLIITSDEMEILECIFTFDFIQD